MSDQTTDSSSIDSFAKSSEPYIDFLQTMQKNLMLEVARAIYKEMHEISYQEVAMRAMVSSGKDITEDEFKAMQRQAATTLAEVERDQSQTSQVP